MKEDWVKYLCDPVDGTKLSLSSVTKKEGKYVKEGELKSKVGRIYKIHDGVPRMLAHDFQDEETVASFGYEWKEFGFEFGKKKWKQGIVNPLVKNTSFFKNKIIVDAGSGAGFQSLWMTQAGAKLVISLELSEGAIQIIKETVKDYQDKVFIIQADIAHPPLKKNNLKADLLYCVNVIQHTKNPDLTLKALSNLLLPRKLFMYNIYKLRERNLLITLINAVRVITQQLPFQVVKVLSFVGALLMCALSNLGFGRDWGSFKEVWLNIYDLMGGHKYQKFFSEDEIETMIHDSGCKILKKSKFCYLLEKV